MFNLYDDDYESVQSDEDGGLGADVTDALNLINGKKRRDLQV